MMMGRVAGLRGCRGAAWTAVLLVLVAGASGSPQLNRTATDNDDLVVSLLSAPTGRKSTPTKQRFNQCLSTLEDDFVDRDYAPSRDEWCDCLAETEAANKDGTLDPESFRSCCRTLRSADPKVLWRHDYVACLDSFSMTDYAEGLGVYTSLGPLGTETNRRKSTCAGFSMGPGGGGAKYFCSDPVFSEYSMMAFEEGAPTFLCSYSADGLNPSVCRVSVGKHDFSTCGVVQMCTLTVGRPWADVVDMQSRCCRRGFEGNPNQCCDDELVVWGWGDDGATDPSTESLSFFARVCDYNESGKRVFNPSPLLTDVSDICNYALEFDMEYTELGEHAAELCDCLEEQAVASGASRSRLFKRSTRAGRDSPKHGTARYQLDLEPDWVETCSLQLYEVENAPEVCSLESSRFFNPRKRKWSSCRE